MTARSPDRPSGFGPFGRDGDDGSRSAYAGPVEETTASRAGGFEAGWSGGDGRFRRAFAGLSDRAVRHRARVTRTPQGRLLWRSGVAVVGGLVLLVGIVTIPGPGQGWATVFLGLAILSTEFRWARRLRDRAWTVFTTTRRRYAASSPRVRAAVVILGAALCAVAIGGVLWLSLVVTGVPGWVPEAVGGPVARLVPGVD